MSEAISPPRKILITGDRSWVDRKMIREILETWLMPGDTLIHGGARGVDRLAGEEAEAMGFAVKSVAALWSQFGRAAGPIRNAKMLTEEPYFVLAVHDDLATSKGTADCVNKARKKGLYVFLHYHTKKGWEYTSLPPFEEVS